MSVVCILPFPLLWGIVRLRQIRGTAGSDNRGGLCRQQLGDLARYICIYLGRLTGIFAPAHFETVHSWVAEE